MAGQRQRFSVYAADRRCCSYVYDIDALSLGSCEEIYALLVFVD